VAEFQHVPDKNRAKSGRLVALAQNMEK
jgi:hypothetical protein